MRRYRQVEYDDDVSGIGISPSVGSYAVGLSARIEDGKPAEPVSTIGPIGFVTKRLTVAAQRRLRKAKK